MYGEHQYSVVPSFALRETSPYTQGIPHAFISSGCSHRTIPVYVGNTHRSPQISAARQKHPRIHGEYSHRVCDCMMALETSPYARGIHHFRCRVQTELRNIPTCVGNTGQDSMGHRKGRNHPHVHGEYLARVKKSFLVLEPSPCARGIQRHLVSSITTHHHIWRMQENPSSYADDVKNLPCT